MKRIILPAALCAALFGFGTVGCDDDHNTTKVIDGRTVSEKRETDVKSDGTVVEKKERVVEKDDGTIVREKSTDVDEPGRVDRDGDGVDAKVKVDVGKD